MIAWPAVLASVAAIAMSQEQASRRTDSASRSDSLDAFVREHPLDARERIAQLAADAAHEPLIGDSLLRAGRQLATAYARVWSDSFPLSHLQWFERLSARERKAKVEADSVRLAGNRALGAAGTSEAMRLWREAHARARTIGDTAGMAAALGNIGVGFYRDWALDSADAYVVRAGVLADAVGDRRTARNALRTRASIAQQRGDRGEARRAYNDALSTSLGIGDVRGAASDHTNLGLIAAELYDFVEARRQYRAALTLAGTHALDDAAAMAMLNLANVESAAAVYDSAASLYRGALDRFQALDDSASAALTRHNLGLLELRRGDYRGARTHLVEARDVFDRVGTVEDRVQVRRDLAAVQAAMGDLRGAQERLRSAEQLLKELPDARALAADVALAQADLSVHLNAFVEADAQYRAAQALYRSAGDIVGELEAAQGQASLLSERKLFARAAEQLEGISRAQVQLGDARSAALTRLTMAAVLREHRDLPAARRTASEALDALRGLGDAVGEAAALAVLGDVERDAGAPVTAAAHYRAGLARLRVSDAPTLEWELHAGLARAARASGDVTLAIDEFRAATGIVERMAGLLPLPERRAMFLSDKWDVYADLALIQRARRDASAAYDASERLRARQTLDLLARGRIAPRPASDTAWSARQQDLRARIRELTQRLEAQEAAMSTLRGPDLSTSASAATREALARTQQEYAQLLLELRGSEEAVATIVRGDVVPWRVVAARLSAGQALLTYLVTDTASVVFVLTPDTVRVVDLNVGRGALASLIEFTRGTVLRPDTARESAIWRTPLRRLYQHLLDPVEQAGLLRGVRELIIVPHGELHYLPFAALIASGPDGREEFLIERYDVGYAPSASAFVQLGKRASPYGRHVLALAPRPADLPGSREEVDAIRATHGADATVLVGAEATERMFRSTVSGYGIVHLATYGVLNQHNPLFSFVELNGSGEDDGRLEVHEVFGLSLNARLLVLSACQTALGSGAVSDVPPGDDWVGLVRAFLTAGASNVIATLWAVEDRATARLMERLHRRLRMGDSEVSALSLAQRQTLRNPATSSPFYWAGFVLVGGR